MADQENDPKKSPKMASGVLIPAGLFLGIGIGWIFGYLLQGIFIGFTSTFIFIVHPPDFDGQPITQNTNIDQSILFDLFNMQHVRKTKVAIDEIYEESDDDEVESLMSIEDFDEEVAEAENEEAHSNNEGVEYADLPDLSEYENMINWGDDADSKEPSSTLILSHSWQTSLPNKGKMS